MTLPEKALFTTQAVCQHLALSRSSVRRLIEEGQLAKAYPRPRAMRITRESLSAHRTRGQTPGAVAASIRAGAQAKADREQAAQEKRKGGLLSRWGLGG